jgi:hypothetical protein
MPNDKKILTLFLWFCGVCQHRLKTKVDWSQGVPRDVPDDCAFCRAAVEALFAAPQKPVDL